MVTFLVAFLLSSMISTVLTVVVRNRALVWGLVDQARSSRKIHIRPVPRLGGVAIVGGFFAPLIGLLLVDSGVGQAFYAQSELATGLFAGGLIIASLGLVDDLRGLGARSKFFVQFLVAAGLYLLGFRIELLANPFGMPLELGWFGLPLTVMWIVGVVNALNLIDGLDGLAGGVAFFGVLTNFILALVRGDVLLSLLMAALAGAILGFLIFNFNPASIFMGDTGSMFLGFVLAAVSIKTSTKSGTAVALLVPVMALGLPIMDTLLAMIRRSLVGRPIFSADKEHIHHRLMSRLVLSHRRAVLVLYGLCTMFMLTALGLAFANSVQSAMLLCGVGAVIYVLMRKLGYLDLGRAAVIGQTRRRNRELRTVVREAVDQIRSSRGRDALWLAVRSVGHAVGASGVSLRLQRHVEHMDDAVVFEAEWEPKRPSALESVHELSAQDVVLGTLVMRWSDGRHEIDRDDELALELVADAVAEAEARLLAAEATDPRVVMLRK